MDETRRGRPKSGRRSWSRVGDDLGNVLREMGIEGPARLAIAAAAWPDVVGETVAAATRVTGVLGSILEVTTRHSGWTQELTFRRERILRELNQRAGAEALTDIRFKVGSVERGEVKAPLPVPTSDELNAILLPPAEERHINEIAAQSEPDLCALIRGVLTYEWRLAEWRRAQGYTPCERCGALCEPGRTVCPVCL